MPKSGILTLAYYFDPNTAIGAVRTSRFHRYLCEMGYESRVIAASVPADCPDPTVYHVPDIADDWYTSGLIAKSNGTPHPAASFGTNVEMVLRRVFVPGHSGIAWSRDAVRVAKKLLHESFTLRTVLSSYPSLGTHLAGLMLAREQGARWIADFRDPFTLAPSVANAFRTRTLNWLERLVFRRADAVIANTESVAAKWREKYPWAKDRIHVIWNGYDPEKRLCPLPVPSRDTRDIVHVGSLYLGRNANVIVSTMAKVRARSAAASHFRIVLTGTADASSGIDEGLYQSAAAEGWLFYHPQQIGRSEAQTVMQEADGLLLLQPQTAVQVPAKLFDYISIGRPILALVQRSSSIEWILSRAGIPFVCIYTDDSPDTAERKMMEYCRMSNEPVEANNWFTTNFDARRLTSQLAGIIDSLAGPPRPTSAHSASIPTPMSKSE